MDISYRVVESCRKTLALQVQPDGEIVVRCPRGVPRYRVQAFVESKRTWLERQLSRQPKADKLTAAKLAELKRQATEDLSRRTAAYACSTGISYGKVTIRCQKTRWGSCSARGNLNFNCLLMLAPPFVRDYVVVHELCHRKQMNHSAAFWAEVAAVLPAYDTSRRWLRENGPQLLAAAAKKK